MTKKPILLLLLILTVFSVKAEKVSKQQALNIAQQFLNKKTLVLDNQQNITHGEALWDEALYVFQAKEGGYVIVSGDDRTAPILGYSETGLIDMGNLPDNLSSWLESYAEQIAYLRKHPESAAPKTLNVPSIQPLLAGTEWNQTSPYNDLCPMDGNRRSYTGCVATAMAQVMYYHKWPEQTTKEIPGYVTSTKQISMPSIPISRIDWDNMLPAYNRNPANDAQKRAVAELMRMCGTALRMDYTSNGSGAPISYIASSLKAYFDYDRSTRYISRDDYHLANWNQLIYDELVQKRPVCYCGFPSSSSGHAFVIDGYDKDDYFHVNWGWGGYCDGYFLLTILNPYDQSDNEKQYGMDGYNLGQVAVIGIQRPTNDDLPVWLTTSSCFSSAIIVSRNSVDQNFMFYMSFDLNNLSEKNAAFEYRMVLLDENDNLLQILSEGDLDDNGTNNYSVSNFYEFGAGLTDGSYFVKMMSREKGSDEWHLNHESDTHYLRFVISGNTIESKGKNDTTIALSGTFQPIGDVELNSQVLLTATVTNNGPDYYDQIYFLEDGDVINGRVVDIAAGETQDITVLYTANTIGEKTFSMAVYAYNPETKVYEFVPFVTGVINVTSANVAYLRMSPLIQNETDGVVKENVVKVNVTITNDGRYYDDDVRCWLFKMNSDNTASVYTYADKHLKLERRSQTTCVFELENIEEGDYILEMMYRRDGSWILPNTRDVYVTVKKDGGDGYITFADPIVENLCLYYWDSNGDGRLTRSEAAAVNSLGDIFCLDPNRKKSWQGDEMTIDNLAHGNFKSFDELQYFTGLTSIDEGTFYGQQSLQSITLPANIKSIGKNAFYYCWNLESIAIPDLVESIGDKAFMSCKSAADISFGGSLKTIGYGAFASCSAVQQVVIPEGCTSIGRMAFHNCEALKSVTVPKTVNSIGSYAFAYTASPLSLHISDLDAWLKVQLIYHPEYDNEDEDGLVDGNGRTTYRLYLDNQEVTSVVIPQSVSSVSNLLQGCVSLTSLTIPNSVSNIAVCAFNGCCNLETVISYIENPFDFEDAAFEYIDENTGGYVFTSATLYVPKGTVQIYQHKYGWKSFKNIVEMNGESAIEDIARDSQAFDVYSLSGMRVKKDASSLKTLPKGVYIVNGQKVVVK